MNEKRKVLWLCGLPEEIRVRLGGGVITPYCVPAWSWVLGHFPPPDDIELHICCPVLKLRVEKMRVELDGVVWHLFRLHRYEFLFFWIRFYFSIKNYIFQLKPDIIHGWGGESGCGLLAVYLHGKKAVVSVQGILKECFKVFPKNKDRVRHKLALIQESITFKHAGILLVESECCQTRIKTLFNRDAVFVPHPLRMSFIESVLPKQRTNKKIIFLGGLTPRKGAMDALLGFHHAKLSGWTLVYVGCGFLLQEMRAYVSEHHLEDCVFFKEWLLEREIIQEMDTASLFLLPSYFDTGPTALKEALAMGLYPICYDNSGPRELILRYQHGQLVPTGDIQAVTKVLKTISESNQIADGQTVGEKIRQDLDKKIVWNMLKELYFANI